MALFRAAEAAGVTVMAGERGDGGPRRVGLDVISNGRIGEHVHGGVVGQQGVENADHRRGEAALGLVPVALHEE
jgi:hypothetical protein